MKPFQRDVGQNCNRALVANGNGNNTQWGMETTERENVRKRSEQKGKNRRKKVENVERQGRCTQQTENNNLVAKTRANLNAVNLFLFLFICTERHLYLWYVAVRMYTFGAHLKRWWMSLSMDVCRCVVRWKCSDESLDNTWETINTETKEEIL